MTRKLAVIIAADVVGYSRLKGGDEAGTMAALKTHRREVIDPKIAEHEGRIVRTTGDGLPVEFPSAVKAVDGDNINGDGGNVAARLEGWAEASGVCASKAVRHEDTPQWEGLMFKWFSVTFVAFLVTVAAAFLVTVTPCLAASKQPIIVFMPPGTDNYLAQWQVGARTKAKELGYDIRIIESSRDQAEQDSQVQQQLASGQDVSGYIWWPYLNAAGTGSLRALSKTGKPVIFTNQYPMEGTDAFWTAYAGVDDFLNGRVAAQMLLDACAKATNVKCGKGMIITFPAGYSAGADRARSFRDTVAGKLEVIQQEPAGFMSQEGYKIGSQIIPPKKNDITWVYTESDSLASGVVQALKEAGKTPGKDVLVVGGTCHGDESDLLNKNIIGTGVQAALLEGWQSVQTLHKYLETKQVKEGKLYLTADPDKKPSDEGAPSRYNFIPNPALANDKAAIDAFRLWGWSFKELCNY